MTALNIDGALIAGYVALGLGLSTAYEGEDFTPPTSASAKWAAVFIVPAVTDFFTLGSNGEDLHTGFMQIDFNVKHGTGRAVLVGYYDAVRAAFIGGKAFTQSSQSVQITSVERSPIREEGGWMRLSVTVNWQAETIRPTIT